MLAPVGPSEKLVLGFSYDLALMRRLRCICGRVRDGSVYSMLAMKACGPQADPHHSSKMARHSGCPLGRWTEDIWDSRTACWDWRVIPSLGKRSCLTKQDGLWLWETVPGLTSGPHAWAYMCMHTHTHVHISSHTHIQNIRIVYWILWW